ncbi:MAG TPA: ABC transporter permease [Leptospiraceae bacterium]|nr:ABC transporter permease [Leptospiraceae bacterium]HNI26709.1 ABC transporter permease [Leptospiraceae bacterium]
MKLFLIAVKTFRENLRDSKSFYTALLFPALLLLIFFNAFGGGGFSDFLNIGLTDRSRSPESFELIQKIRSLKFENSPVFSVREGSDSDIFRLCIAEGRCSAAAVIPEMYSADAGKGKSEIELYGDTASDLYSFTEGFAEQALLERLEELNGKKISAGYRISFHKKSGTSNDFLTGLPGILVFAVFFGVIFTSMILNREETSGSFLRIRMSGTGISHYLSGVLIFQIFFSFLQIFTAISIIYILGFRMQGSILQTGFIILILNLPASGLGYAAAAFSRNTSEAVNIGTALMLPPVFLSGSLFPMDTFPVNLFGYTVNILSVFPSSDAADLIRKILIFGDSLNLHGGQIIQYFIISTVYFLSGLFIYRYRLSSGRKEI